MPAARFGGGRTLPAARVTAADLFGRITARLDRAGIPYMLTGSFAAA